MEYDYEKQRDKLFTEKGIRTLFAVRDNVKQLLDNSGAFIAYNVAEKEDSELLGFLALEFLNEIHEIQIVARLEDSPAYRVYVSDYPRSKQINR